MCVIITITITLLLCVTALLLMKSILKNNKKQTINQIYYLLDNMIKWVL